MTTLDVLMHVRSKLGAKAAKTTNIDQKLGARAAIEIVNDTIEDYYGPQGGEAA